MARRILPRQTHAARAALRLPAFRGYLISCTISVCGSAVAPIALAAAILDLGAGGSGIALVLAAEYVCYLALMPLAGLIADRVLNVKRVLVNGQLTAAACQGLVAVMLMTETARLWQLAVIAGVGATGASLRVVAGRRLMSATVPVELAHPANALLRVGRMTIAVFGPAVGGMLVVTVGASWAIAWDGVSFLLAAVVMIRVPAVVAEPESKPAPGALAEGWRQFLRRRWLWSLTAGVAIHDAAWMAAFILGPLYAREHLGGIQAWGLVNALLAAGSVLGGLVAMAWPVRRPGLAVAAGYIAGSVGLGALGLGAALPVVCAAMFAGAALSGPAQVAFAAAVQIHVPQQVQGRVSSVIEIVAGIAVPVAYAAAGPAADAHGSQPVITACVAVTVLAALAPLFIADVRQLTVPTPDKGSWPQ